MSRYDPDLLRLPGRDRGCDIAAGAERAGAMTVLEGLLTMAPAPRILHVSADFPDQIDGFKTPVVRSLVDLTEGQFRHEVVSLNRRSPDLLGFARNLIAGWGRPVLSVSGEAFSHGQALVYKAPPSGLFHATMLRQLGDWLAGEHAGPRLPDLIVGHKLTIEGIAVRRAANRLGVPFAVCIQGDTDTKVLAARPDLARKFARVFHEAAVVFPFTPWALRHFEQRFGRRTGATVMLPCPTDLDEPTPPFTPGDGLVSVFHLKNHRRKNLHGMVAALRLLHEEGLETSLEVIGGGSERELAHCRRVARGAGSVIFKGPLDREALRQRLNRATGFILPSVRESFGLVFIEALFAGLPVIYPRKTAIDGYFDGFSFAIGVDARDAEAIAAAMRTIVSEERKLKADLWQWQQSDHARQFMRGSIVACFANGLTRSLDICEEAEA